MRYAINVVDKTAEIRDINLSIVLDEEYIPILNKNSMFIGFGSPKEWLDDNINKKYIPKFLNWYDNSFYIKIWNSKEEAQIYLSNLLDKANKNYKSKKDPFHHLEKTKGDWKNFMFVVADITNYNRND